MTPPHSPGSQQEAGKKMWRACLSVSQAHPELPLSCLFLSSRRDTWPVYAVGAAGGGGGCCLHPGSRQAAQACVFSSQRPGVEGMLGAISSCHSVPISTIKSVELVMVMSTHLVAASGPGTLWEAGGVRAEEGRTGRCEPSSPTLAQPTVWSCGEGGLQAQLARANLVSWAGVDRAQDS